MLARSGVAAGDALISLFASFLSIADSIILSVLTSSILLKRTLQGS